MSFGMLLLLAACVEKDLLQPEGSVKFVYDWGGVAENGGKLPERMMVCFYPLEPGKMPISKEIGAVAENINLPGGSYKVLTFNPGVSHVGFENLNDFEMANARLQPMGARSSESLFPSPGWLFGGSLPEITVGNGSQMEVKVGMQSYVKRVKVAIEADISVIDTSFGSLDNTAVGVRLKDGQVAPAGNGTVCFELHKTEQGLLADFTIFGVDETAVAAGGLKNHLHFTLQDLSGRENDFVLDVTGKLGDALKPGDGREPVIVEDVAGLGVVKIIVSDWIPDDEDNSVSETRIRLAAFTGVPVRSGLAEFAGTFGVYVAAKGQAPGRDNFYKNVRVEAPGGVMSETMYYPTGGNVDIYAYAPFKGIAGTAEATLNFTLAAATTEAELKQNDFLWANLKNQVETAGELPLVFDHRMSQLEVQVIRGEGISSALDFTGTTVEILGLRGEATIRLTDGAVTVNQTVAVQNIVPVTTAAEVDKITTKAIVIPQTTVSGMSLFRICVGGANGQPYIYKPAAPLVFRPGYRQVVRLTLKDGVAPLSRSGERGCEWAVSEEKW